MGRLSLRKRMRKQWVTDESSLGTKYNTWTWSGLSLPFNLSCPPVMLGGPHPMKSGLSVFFSLSCTPVMLGGAHPMKSGHSLPSSLSCPPVMLSGPHPMKSGLSLPRCLSCPRTPSSIPLPPLSQSVFPLLSCLCSTAPVSRGIWLPPSWASPSIIA